MSVYWALKDYPSEFIKSCEKIRPAEPDEEVVFPKNTSSGKKYNARLKAKFDELVLNRNANRALSYFFINRTVWGGRVNYDIESRLYFSNPTGWNIVKTDRLWQAAAVLKGTKITCGSYEELLSSDGEDVFIYCDPPYVVDTSAAAPSKLYQASFTLEDHQNFRDYVTKSPHKICISYDDDPQGMVRKWYSGKQFNINECAWTYCGTSSADGASKTKKKGRELIITNYPPEKPKRIF